MIALLCFQASDKKRACSDIKMNGNTLLEGVCTFIIITLQKIGMFMTVIECHSLNYDILNADMTLFKMSLL